MKHKLFISVLAIFLSLAISAQENENENTDANISNSTTPATLSWPGELLSRFSTDLEDELDSQGAKLSASIFESLTDVELYSFGYGVSDVGLKVQRKVYNNHDILDTFTVIDFLKVPLSIPISMPLDDGVRLGTGGNLGLSLGLNLSLNTMNIRQVLPKGLDKLPGLTELNQFAEEAISLDDLNNLEELQNESKDESEDHKEESEDQDEQDSNPQNFILENLGEVLSWRSQNPLARARYKRIFNLLTHPFRLPFTEKSWDRLDVGEIVSYSLDGSVQLGASVGWSGLEFLGAEGLSAGLSLSTYLHGGFKVSIMKEGENQAQVKLSRRHTKGYAASVGAGSPDHEVFSGIMVLGNNVGRITEQVIPFNISLNRPLATSFDVGYRYDLSKPEAKKAYFRATFGRLKYSDDLAHKNDSGVTKVFTREQRSQAVVRNYKMKLSVFLQRGHVSSRTTAQAKITLGEDSHHIFRSTNVNSRGYDTLWEDGESRRYSFDTTVSQNEFDASLDKGMALKVEATIEDEHTTGYEAHRYMTEVMKVTGQTDLFPILPKFEPKIKCDDVGLSRWTHHPGRNRARGRVNSPCNNRQKQTHYGKTRFYYKLGFSRNQLEKFIHLPEEQMWEVLAMAFELAPERWNSLGSRIGSALLSSYATLLNLPLTAFDLHFDNGSRIWEAKSFFNRWLELKTIKDPEEMTKVVSKMFDTHWHSYNFIKIIKLALPGEEIGYYVSASAKHLFGTISKQGKVIDTVDTISSRASDLIEFDRLGSRTNVDTSANTNELEIKKVAKDSVEVTFTLSEEPKLIYIRVDQSASWRSYKTLARYIIKNTGFLKKGKNKFIVNKDGDDVLSKLFSAAVFNDQYNTLMMAISVKDAAWGTVASKRFKIR